MPVALFHDFFCLGGGGGGEEGILFDAWASFKMLRKYWA